MASPSLHLRHLPRQPLQPLHPWPLQPPVLEGTPRSRNAEVKRVLIPAASPRRDSTAEGCDQQVASEQATAAQQTNKTPSSPPTHAAAQTPAHTVAPTVPAATGPAVTMVAAPPAGSAAIRAKTPAPSPAPSAPSVPPTISWSPSTGNGSCTPVAPRPSMCAWPASKAPQLGSVVLSSRGPTQPVRAHISTRAPPVVFRRAQAAGPPPGFSAVLRPGSPAMWASSPAGAPGVGADVRMTPAFPNA